MKVTIEIEFEHDREKEIFKNLKRDLVKYADFHVQNTIDDYTEQDVLNIWSGHIVRGGQRK